MHRRRTKKGSNAEQSTTAENQAGSHPKCFKIEEKSSKLEQNILSRLCIVILSFKSCTRPCAAKLTDFDLFAVSVNACRNCCDILSCESCKGDKRANRQKIEQLSCQLAHCESRHMCSDAYCDSHIVFPRHFVRSVRRWKRSLLLLGHAFCFHRF